MANLSRSDTNENHERQSRECVRVLTRWMENWTEIYPNNIVSMKAIRVYADALKNLSPSELDNACREATRFAKEVFPKPGHITEAHRSLMLAAADSTDYIKPHIGFPPVPADDRLVTPEERERIEKLKAQIGLDKPSSEHKKVLVIKDKKSLAEQIRELKARGYLA